MKEALPAPLKPQYREARSLSHRLASKCVPLVNASYALEVDFNASNNYCNFVSEDSTTETALSCASVESHTIFTKRSEEPNIRSGRSRFPLPSRKDLKILKTWNANLPPTTFYFLVMVAEIGFWLALTATLLNKWGHPSAERRFYVTLRWHPWTPPLCVAWTVWLMTWHGLNMRSLTIALAKDQFIGTCILQKVSLLPYTSIKQAWLTQLELRLPNYLCPICVESCSLTAPVYLRKTRSGYGQSGADTSLLRSIRCPSMISFLCPSRQHLLARSCPSL